MQVLLFLCFVSMCVIRMQSALKDDEKACRDITRGKPIFTALGAKTTACSLNSIPVVAHGRGAQNC